MADLTTRLIIKSFGFGHGAPPVADHIADARRFRDPHRDKAFRQLTGLDQAVIDHVLATEGVRDYIDALAEFVVKLLRTQAGTITIAVGCVGGRHRSVVIANELARLVAADWNVEIQVEHLHRHLPVIERRSGVDRVADQLMAFTLPPVAVDVDGAAGIATRNGRVTGFLDENRELCVKVIDTVYDGEDAAELAVAILAVSADVGSRRGGGRRG